MYCLNLKNFLTSLPGFPEGPGKERRHDMGALGFLTGAAPGTEGT